MTDRTLRMTDRTPRMTGERDISERGTVILNEVKNLVQKTERDSRSFADAQEDKQDAQKDRQGTQEDRRKMDKSFTI